VLFDSAGGRDVGQVYQWTMTGGGQAASEHYSTHNVAIAGDELRVAALVRVGGVVVGVVGVGRPITTVADGVSHARWRLAAIGLGIGCVMLVAGWWLAQRLTHSLERLTAHAEAVRDGRPSTPPVSRAAEISTLARAFEEMRTALEGKAYVERYTQALAHEFKAPLSAIRGAAELLAENPPEPDRARFIANLRAESDRLQLIVDRLLELAALEARRAGAALAEVDLREVVQEVCDSACVTAGARRIALVWTPAAAPTVRGEKFLLAQAIGNLVHNALEFTPAGGTVTLTLEERDGRAIVTVTDTGPGVPAYALEKVFERFYSLPRPDTGRKSSGLGLSIVREIARLHGGEATLENRPEGGARAVLAVPIAG
jgi:two-component system sensor histidine kinase CreC